MLTVVQLIPIFSPRGQNNKLRFTHKKEHRDLVVLLKFLRLVLRLK